MSVLDEPSESTPLRRINLRQQQSQSRNHSEQQLSLSTQPSTQTPASRLQNQSGNFSEYITINNNNTIVQSGDSSDNNNSDFNTTNGKNMSDTSRILTRITIDFAILLIGESLILYLIQQETKNMEFLNFVSILLLSINTRFAYLSRQQSPFISNDFKASVHRNYKSYARPKQARISEFYSHTRSILFSH